MHRDILHRDLTPNRNDERYPDDGRVLPHPDNGSEGDTDRGDVISIQLVGDSLLQYDIELDTELEISLLKNSNVVDITALVNDEVIEFNDLGSVNNVTISIPGGVFNQIRRYTIRLYPFSFSKFLEDWSQRLFPDRHRNVTGVDIIDPITRSNYSNELINEAGLTSNRTPDEQFIDGDRRTIPNPADSTNFIEVLVDVTRYVKPQNPIIYEVTYPSKIRGADYIGYNVDFTISWKSRETQYVKIHIGESTDSIRAVNIGEQTFNVQSLLETYPNELIKDGSNLTIPIRLVPYAIMHTGDVEGAHTLLNIEFKPGILIPRETAISRMVDGFMSTYDDSMYKEHRFLNHLMHVGDGDNKLVANWTGVKDDIIQVWDFDEKDNIDKKVDTLVLKLYEPLPSDIQVNQKVWITKLQSEPTLETIILTSKEDRYCQPLKGPNFNIETSNSLGFQSYDNLIASGSETSHGIVNEYLNKSGIDTTGLNIIYSEDGKTFEFENFVHFSSAEERLKNFWYKLQLKEKYETDIESWNEHTGSAESVVRIKTINNNIDKLIGSFDGFEHYLYTSLYTSPDDICYPKDSNNEVVATSDVLATNWYNKVITMSNTFDRNNPHYLNNNLPKFIKTDYQNEDFMLFMDMMGQHFDIIWSYIKALSHMKELNRPKSVGIFDDMVYHMLKSLGWEGTKAFNSNYLWEYAFGLYKDGTQKHSMPTKNASNEVWRRVLHNLPYLLKHKGTARSIKAMLSCYGVPNSLLTIIEYGGPQIEELGDTREFTFEDRTAAIRLDGNQTIELPWKSSSDYPQAIEIMVRPSEIKTCTLLETDGFSLWLIRHSESYVRLRFTMGSNYDSDPFKISTENFSNIIINRNSSGNYTIWLKESDGYRITKEIEITATPVENWGIGGNLVIGNEFVGHIDEFRLWREPLEEKVFNNHTLFPDAINGNTKTSYETDLLFRLDFEHPKDRAVDTGIKNVAISQQYDVEFATAVGFEPAPTYPHQYIPYHRTVTAQVPTLGFNFSNKFRFNKFRFEDIELIQDLSPNIRATKKAFDRAPVDSSKLGLFFSANKELNMDIVKSFGPVNIGNVIGNPEDEAKDYYPDLIPLRNAYFKNLKRNIYEYITLVRYIDRTLFDNLKLLIPARAKLVSGLLIEPHLLERSKIRREKPISSRDDIESYIDANIVELTHQMDNYESSIDIDNFSIDYEMNNYSGEVDVDPREITFEYSTYESDIKTVLKQFPLDVRTDYPFELFEQNILEMSGYTISDGGGINLLLDKAGNITNQRSKIYLVRERYYEWIMVQTKGWPATTDEELVEYERSLVERYRYKLLTLPWSEFTPTPIGNIIEITPLTGYTQNHYRYVNNLTGGLRRSFYIGSKQNDDTTPDGLPAVEVFPTNPNVVKVADTRRSRGEPLLGVR